MRFSIVTLFPEFFDSPLSCGLLSRAREKGLVHFTFINPRDYSTDRHHHVDDRPYGGGPGMVMCVDPVRRALDTIPDQVRILLLSPKGRPLTQTLAKELAKEQELVLVCGRYEGIDARLEELCTVEAVSVGDFVLNGGESGALCLIEAVSRLVPDFMGKNESADEESFSSGLLEYPHYTRPEEYEGIPVPQVLASGHHEHIARWRHQKSLEITLACRPDLLSEAALSQEDMRYLQSLDRLKLGRNLYVALVHFPVENKSGEIITTSLTNLDLHDIARVSCTYELGGYYVCTPVHDQQILAQTLVNHWRTGLGSTANPDRRAALEQVHVVSLLDDAITDIKARTGRYPKVVATSAKTGTGTFTQVKGCLEHGPVLVVLGTGHGLGPEIMVRADILLRPIRFMDSYNHLSVRSAASIMVDRLVGDVG
ncbi:MAG: tRNA (guanosine(37)-N1)-methyltransferase TrmD [Desulfovibrionales bacterium]|jgi:tRNA (guanine37-N1)-methyltransferase|nr:tRNA (guanosine(37)-N1)-methyltransferase TrmD [Desulfovibrionales bacterium]